MKKDKRNIMKNFLKQKDKMKFKFEGIDKNGKKKIIKIYAKSEAEALQLADKEIQNKIRIPAHFASGDWLDSEEYYNYLEKRVKIMEEK